jgi:hypothetical protein
VNNLIKKVVLDVEAGATFPPFRKKKPFALGEQMVTTLT